MRNIEIEPNCWRLATGLSILKGLVEQFLIIIEPQIGMVYNFL
ncbi:hypothetical protein Dtox_1901 [Desulfofarcimen acetoxidans DSM 771]|uniref:Uncharacterized protein n=1 Tax=Desulfofarcimen acetoxidans (strain ATCC 49208 / DSM 771 / KCTC 5769 / VKM B-1644 / 5575) TaxID=485916 RepID=C8VXT6_DESAS|nr:hypothetical protein Dtox_1901 [Desulfofarcimen acetoxidans DSM 771]